MQIKLNGRLLAASRLVLPGLPAADIGADHSYLPVYLVTNNICPLVIATDKASRPIENARQLVDLLSLSHKIPVRRGDGLQAIAPGEAATVVMAGMGGMLIMEMLAASPEVTAKVKRLVLQPQKNIDLLRRWLADNGWRIVAEDIAFDSGFYYVVMAAEPGKMELSEDEAEFGPCLISEPHPLLPQYLGLKLADLRTLCERLEHNDGAEAQRRLEQLDAQARRIEAILTRIAGRRASSAAENMGSKNEHA